MKPLTGIAVKFALFIMKPLTGLAVRFAVSLCKVLKFTVTLVVVVVAVVTGF